MSPAFYIFAFGVPTLALALLVAGMIVERRMRRYTAVSPFDRIMTKRERKLYRIVPALWSVSTIVFGLGYAITISGGWPNPLPLTIIALVVWLMVRRLWRAKMLPAQLHAAFDGEGECQPIFLASALERYKPTDGEVSVTPMHGDRKLYVKCGDREFKLLLPTIYFGRIKLTMEPNSCMMLALQAVPPALLGFTVTWKGGSRDTSLLLPPAQSAHE
jgi:hypothetical protein